MLGRLRQLRIRRIKVNMFECIFYFSLFFDFSFFSPPNITSLNSIWRIKEIKCIGEIIYNICFKKTRQMMKNVSKTKKQKNKKIN
jgi:hypothetical protein